MTHAYLSIDDSQPGLLVVSFSGAWILGTDLPSVAPVLADLGAGEPPGTVRASAADLGDWDTGLVKAIVAIRRGAEKAGIELDVSELPDGVQKLVALAFAVKAREGAQRTQQHKPFLEDIGEEVLEIVEGGRQLLTFAGNVTLSFVRFLTGRAAYLGSDLGKYIQAAGASALPIVSLISLLIGMIFAFVGVMQLEAFGAGIYTANLVAVAMVREMAPIMTAIILAGRTGAAYAAEIGTMKVNEEVDALTTLGINPIDFLVTPRVIALVVMMPLLTAYASLLGIIGGAAVGVTMLDISLVQYVAQTIDSVDLGDLAGGLFKSIVYGSLVALAGCKQGMSCGTSAMAVGQSTTKAVVAGIVLIVVSASVLTIIYINLGI
jgi:phospholipid/cholesterol/gamma-HCH transport system permease protein